jgi:parvulin-like peptidyl-prolyl isomerase
MARSWAREPLFHFLLAGAAIFAITALWPGGDSRTITIDRGELTEYLLARARISDRRQFEAYYQSLSPDAREMLLHDAGEDEALYREGLAIGLDRADPLIRQRMIQQMRELISDEAAAGQQLTDAALEDYYLKHQDKYRRDDTVSFAHVFFADGRDAAGAGRRARAELERLRAAGTPPAEAAAHGERFLYETFNRDVGTADVAAKFGAEFARALSGMEPGSWQGPLRSEHGWHLVYVTGRVPGHVPTMEELGARLREDAEEARRNQAANTALEKMLGDYRIVTRDLPP